MIKKIIATIISLSMFMCGASLSFASETDVISNSTAGITPITQDGDTSVDPLSNKHRTVKVHVKTTSGTQYNDGKTRRCDWTEKHYKVYQENIGTGARQFKYNEYQWSWKGYKKVSGSWKYVKTKSGTTRDQTDASDIYSFLTSF